MQEESMISSGAYDGHASKRQRTEGDNYGQPGKRDIYEDPINPSPSPVVHVRGLTESATERELIDALQSFGTISYIMVLTRKRQALVEFEDINGAMSVVKYAESNPVYVGQKQAHFNYSTSQKIQRPSPENEKPNQVLLFTILNPRYTITVDVMHTICSPNGTVNRIVIFKKNGVQCMVEFENVDAAIRAKQSLNGADIYSGCCTLRIEYAKPTRLNVFHNNNESWDYTNPGLGKEQQSPTGRGQPLLAEPRYGAAPSPFGPEAPGRRGPPGQAQGGMMMDYGQQDGGYDMYGNRRADAYQQPGMNDRYGRDPYGQAQYGNYPPGPGAQPEYDANGAARGMYQQGSVLMVYGLNHDKMNCNKLFNLFCLYGNVVRVKFLKSKEGVAMVQLGDTAACERAMKNLHNNYFFGNKMQLSFSKQAYLQDQPNQSDLTDSTPSFQDYMGNRNNRFSNPEAAAKNRIQPPSKTLYFWNAPAGLSEDQINQLFEEGGCKAPSRVKIFPARSEKSSTGLVEWEGKGEALEGLICGNHCEIPNPTGKYPYVFKLCFSATPIKMGIP